MVDRIEGGQNKLCRCVINPTDEETCLDASKYLFEIFSWSENGWKIFIWTTWVAILLWRISPTAKRINEKTTGVTFTPVKTIYHCATFRLSFEVLYALKFDKIVSTTETWDLLTRSSATIMMMWGLGATQFDLFLSFFPYKWCEPRRTKTKLKW